MNNTQRIIGIDPGSRFTGIGIIDSSGQHSRCIYHGVIKLGSAPFPERLGTIFEELTILIKHYSPDRMAIEDIFMAKNASSALKLGQARGAAICAGVVNHLPVSEYAPRLVKQAVVGRGGADKEQVQQMVRILLNIHEKLSIDASDALGVALCDAHHYIFNQKIKSLSTR